jgi:hypothetical protein
MQHLEHVGAAIVEQRRRRVADAALMVDKAGLMPPGVSAE